MSNYPLFGEIGRDINNPNITIEFRGEIYGCNEFRFGHILPYLHIYHGGTFHSSAAAIARFLMTAFDETVTIQFPKDRQILSMTVGELWRYIRQQGSIKNAQDIKDVMV